MPVEGLTRGQIDDMERLGRDAYIALLDEKIRAEEAFRANTLLLREKYVSPAMTAEEVFEKILLSEAKGDLGVTTGVDWWDEFAGPFRRGNTYLFAGYPGVGKTTLLIVLAWAMAKKGLRVWLYNLELQSHEVFEVLAGHIMKTTELTPEHYAAAYAAIQATGFRFYEPQKYQSWDKRLAEIEATVRKEKLDCVIIDNLGFLTRSIRDSFEVEGIVSARLKGLAQELEIPIIVIHHLRKPSDDTREPEPSVHAMKGSGAIAADASDVFILHHPLMDSSNGEMPDNRHEVGYIQSGKPRWGRGGRRFVRLAGGMRNYFGAPASSYEGGKRRRREYEE